MRRSNANARAAVPERPIVPRPRDTVADWEELFSEAASLGFTTNSGVSCENVTCDFSDAYCRVLVHPEEFKNCLVAAPPSPSGSDQNVALMCRMVFGSKGAPLTWCRIAAALGSAAQAILMGARWSGHAAGRVNTYIDDPLLNLLGTQTQRDKQLRAVLLFWTAAGFKVAWAKGTRSKVAKWIGLQFAPDFQSHTVTVRQAGCARTAGRRDVSSFEEAPPVRGKGWLDHESPSQSEVDNPEILGSHRRRRMAIRSLKGGKARRHNRGGTRNYLIARRQVEVSLRWIVAFWSDQGLSFSRVFGATRPPAEFELILGGVLTTASSSEMKLCSSFMNFSQQMIVLVSRLIWVMLRDSNVGKLCQSWWASNCGVPGWLSHRQWSKSRAIPAQVCSAQQSWQAPHLFFF